ATLSRSSIATSPMATPSARNSKPSGPRTSSTTSPTWNPSSPADPANSNDHNEKGSHSAPFHVFTQSSVLGNSLAFLQGEPLLDLVLHLGWLHRRPARVDEAALCRSLPHLADGGLFALRLLRLGL